MKMPRKELCLKVLLAMAVMILVFSPAISAAPENRLAVNEYPVIQMDPAQMIDYYDSGVFFNLYDPLVYPTPEGKIRPHLAEKWEASKDLQKWTFQLRKGIKFHDGSEVTAEDAAFSMNRMKTMGMGFSFFYADVASVSVDGPFQVTFNLSKPNATFPATLAMLGILNKDLVMKQVKKEGKFGDQGDYGMAWLGAHDAGSGPYLAVEYKTNEYLLVKRFQDYWLGWEKWRPGLEPIETGLFREMWEASTIKTLMKNREHDYTDWYQADEFYDGLGKVEGIRVIEMPIGATYIAWMNTRKPPLDDIHFRKAIAYAFDYTSLAETVRGGMQPKGPVPALYPGHDPKVFTFSRDLAKARAELSKSKYKPGDIELELIATAGVPTNEKISLQLQANLAELGIKLKVSIVPWSRISTVVYNEKECPHFSVFMFSASYPDTDFFFNFMYNPAATGGIFAGHWHAEPEFGKLIATYKGIPDAEQRASIYAELQNKIMDKALGIYAVQVPAVHAIQEYIEGPKEIYPMVGPEMNLRNYQIDLKKKARFKK